MVKPAKMQDSIEATLARAGSLLRSGRPDQAMQILDPVLRKFPDNGDLLKLGGMALSMMGRHEDAERFLRARLQADPANVAARSDLANVLLSMERPDDALELLDELAADELEDSARFNLARALKGVGRTSEAAGHLETLLHKAPRHSGALMSLSDCYKALGRSEDAAQLTRQVIRQAPSNGVAWWSLSNLKAGGFTAEERSQLEQLANQPRPAAQQHFFEFALATALAEAGEHDRAFEHYVRGNRLKRSLAPWDRRQFAQWLQSVEQAFGTLPKTARPEELPTPRPVFIVSLPRSGSTLTEQILAAHPQVTAASELPWVPRILGEENSRRGMGISDWASRASEEDWLRLGEEYMRRSDWWQQAGGVFTDKLPGNFPYTPAILKMLPAALVVNVKRDARDVCWSCYRQLFISGAEFSYDLEDLADFWRLHRDFMNRWAERHPDRVLQLSYEQLVDDPEREARKLLEFVGLPWDDRCLRFYEARRAGQYRQRQPGEAEDQP